MARRQPRSAYKSARTQRGAPFRGLAVRGADGRSSSRPHLPGPRFASGCVRSGCELPALGGGGASPWLESPAGSVEMESEQRAEQGAEQHHCCGLLQQDLAELCTPTGIASVPTVTVRPFSVEPRVQSPADWQSCIRVLLLNDGVSAGSSCEGPLLTLQDAFLLLWFGAPQDGPSSSAPLPRRVGSASASIRAVSPHPVPADR
eukprot:XP_024999357.1 uncharacterized protein LOC112530295 isoform X1 [Gallus gallus]